MNARHKTALSLRPQVGGAGGQPETGLPSCSGIGSASRQLASDDTSVLGLNALDMPQFPHP